MIKKQLQAVAKAYQQLKNNYYSGKSIDSMRREFLRDVKVQLGDGVAFKYDFICGNDTLNIDGVTKKYIPKVGDTLIIDISVRFNGVWCDVCRTFFIGKPTTEQVNAFNMVVKSIEFGETTLKAGAYAEQVYNAVNGVYNSHNKSLIHHAGHKIGSRALMQPQFLQGKLAKIKAGNYYTIESGVYEGFGLRIENDYFITESGNENLFIDLMPLNIESYILE